MSTQADVANPKNASFYMFGQNTSRQHFKQDVRGSRTGKLVGYLSSCVLTPNVPAMTIQQGGWLVRIVWRIAGRPVRFHDPAVDGPPPNGVAGEILQTNLNGEYAGIYDYEAVFQPQHDILSFGDLCIELGLFFRDFSDRIETQIQFPLGGAPLASIGFNSVKCT